MLKEDVLLLKHVKDFMEIEVGVVSPFFRNRLP